jgi:hypothetical protein
VLQWSEKLFAVFSQEGNSMKYNNVDSLIEQHDINERLLFIDSPKLSLKTVLPHIGNK